MSISVDNNDMLNKLILQHQNNYKSTVIEIIKNNTLSLIEEDIISLIKKPPLASMDLLEQKLLFLAKRENLVLNYEILTKLLSDYREKLIDNIRKLKEFRNDSLIKKVEEFNPKRDLDIICIETNMLDAIDKNIKKKIKSNILKFNNDILLKNIDNIYKNDINIKIKQKIATDFEKYIKTTYQKQLLESISIKIMIKDRTLISRINEQGERYLFTKSNSHIFVDEDMNTTC